MRLRLPHSTVNPLEGRPWSKGRLLSLVLVFFWAQLGLIWLLGGRPVPTSPPEVFEMEVEWAPARVAGDLWDVWPWLSDPAVIPLPSPHGFSGPAWFPYPRLQHQVIDWIDEPHWLALDPTSLGTALDEALAREIPAPTRLADQPIPPVAADVVVTGHRAPPARSRLEIQGDLAFYPLRSELNLPSWAHGEILTNTLVQVAVQDDGTVFSAVLLRSCGLPQADEFALTQSRAARFQPIQPTGPAEGEGAPPPLLFGILVYRWHTQPPSPSISTAQTGA